MAGALLPLRVSFTVMRAVFGRFERNTFERSQKTPLRYGLDTSFGKDLIDVRRVLRQLKSTAEVHVNNYRRNFSNGSLSCCIVSVHENLSSQSPAISLEPPLLSEIDNLR